jgi:hypothetical protein
MPRVASGRQELRRNLTTVNLYYNSVSFHEGIFLIISVLPVAGELHFYRAMGESLVSETVACITCKHIFDVSPSHCPSCEAATFVHLNAYEDAQSICEELLVVAAMKRMQSSELQLQEEAAPKKRRVLRNNPPLHRKAVAK